MYNSTYGVCCPRGFGVYAPYYRDIPDRPFIDAACTSRLVQGGQYDITSYDSTAYLTVVPTTAPENGTFVRVNAFDGIISTATSTSTSSTATSSSTASSCATPAANVSVTFQVPYAVTDSADGEAINIVGSTDGLGSWVTNDSIPMDPTFYSIFNPLWETTVVFPAGTQVQYKYLHYLADGNYTSTIDPAYNLTVAISSCSGTQTVRDTWNE